MSIDVINMISILQQDGLLPIQTQDVDSDYINNLTQLAYFCVVNTVDYEMYKEICEQGKLLCAEISIKKSYLDEKMVNILNELRFGRLSPRGMIDLFLKYADDINAYASHMNIKIVDSGNEGVYVKTMPTEYIIVVKVSKYGLFAYSDQCAEDVVKLLSKRIIGKPNYSDLDNACHVTDIFGYGIKLNICKILRYQAHAEE